EHPERYSSVLNRRADEKEPAPQLVVHAPVIRFIEAPDTESQLAWEQDFGLTDIAVGSPDGSNTHKVFQRMDTSAVRKRNGALFVDVDAVAAVHHAVRESVRHGVIGEGVFA